MDEVNTPLGCLRSWLNVRLQPMARQWLDERIERVSTGDRSALFLGFGLVPRKTGKADLKLTANELSAAESSRPGWSPAHWTTDQAARILLLLHYPSTDPASFVHILDQLFNSGEVGELVALYQALPILPHPTEHVWRARECVRTNMKTVFQAMAHHNPYPAEHLDESSWNQLVLKCLFIGAVLDPVAGIETRSNPRLVRMLSDYAHERWAAKRVVSPELWRPIGPFADAIALDDLHHVITTGTPIERQAARLALRSCPAPRAKELLATVTDLPETTWAAIAEQLRSS